MTFWDWLCRRRERDKWASRLSIVNPESHIGIPALDEATARLYGKGLPRNVMMPRPDADREAVNHWMRLSEGIQRKFQPGQIMLGKLARLPLGHLDDRPMVTIAGARAGKTSTVLEPNLYLYPGSMVVLDPKGELAKRTAVIRAELGHQVYVLDPFGQSGVPSASFNVLEELDPESTSIIDDVAAITQAIIVDEGDTRNKHWNDSARTLLQGIILFTLTLPREEQHLITVRQLLNLTHQGLIDALRSAPNGKLDEDFYAENRAALESLLLTMAMAGEKFQGILAAVGKRFLNTPPNERGSIFSTAAAQTDFLDSLPLRAISQRSQFPLRALAGDQPTTIYLCLPVGRMETHYRWLRMIVQQACTTLEKLGTYPRDKHRILFLMEEFPVLGHMDIMERAAAYFPGFGVTLWSIVQDITQLKRYYEKGWETFLGNAGVVQCFSNSDQATLDYMTARMENLIRPFELRTAFSRNENGQVLMFEGEQPLAAVRLTHAEVDYIRQCAIKEAASRKRQTPLLGKSH
jgi:type IV secretion system protein VirD4